MIRRALIIGGYEYQNEDCGIKKDLAYYSRFLSSPYGGAWKDNEILTLSNPNKDDLKKALSETAKSDFSFVVYSGHGWHDTDDDELNLEVHQNFDVIESDISELTEKGILILDCCRKPMSKAEMILEAAMESADLPIEPNHAKCRYEYDKAIKQADSGQATLYSCLFNQSANGDEELGGLYSYALLRQSQQWADRSYNETLSVSAAHNTAKNLVARKARLQTPHLRSPRSMKNYPPFAVSYY